MLGQWQGIWPYLVSHPGNSLVLLGLAVALWLVSARLRAMRQVCEGERRGREEMEAYLRLDVRLERNGDLRAFGERVCGVIAARSVFSRIALLARDAEGDLYLAASHDMDEVTAAAVRAWARDAVEREHSGGSKLATGVCLGGSSLVVSLGEPGRAVVVPLQTAGERMAGALIVCADSILQVQRRGAEEAVAGLEALAAKLAREMENVDSARRTRRVERLAGKLMQSRSYPLKVVVRNGSRPRESATIPAPTR